MGPAQSLFQAPLLILCWVGLVVLPAALFSTRQLHPRGAWLAVALVWGGVGGFQLALSLSDRGQFLGLGALVLGMALLVGLQRVVWRPRAEGLRELRRVAVLALPGFSLAVAAMSGTEEALGWSELSALRRTFESGLAQLPLLVSPRVALVVTYFGLWCLAAWSLPERWRIAPEELPESSAALAPGAPNPVPSDRPKSRAGTPDSKTCQEGPRAAFALGAPNPVPSAPESKSRAGTPDSKTCQEGPRAAFAPGAPNPVSQSNESSVRAPSPELRGSGGAQHPPAKE